jgi:hypothetical protein
MQCEIERTIGVSPLSILLALRVAIAHLLSALRSRFGRRPLRRPAGCRREGGLLQTPTATQPRHPEPRHRRKRRGPWNRRRKRTCGVGRRCLPHTTTQQDKGTQHKCRAVCTTHRRRRRHRRRPRPRSADSVLSGRPGCRLQAMNCCPRGAALQAALALLLRCSTSPLLLLPLLLLPLLLLRQVLAAVWWQSHGGGGRRRAAAARRSRSRPGLQTWAAKQALPLRTPPPARPSRHRVALRHAPSRRPCCPFLLRSFRRVARRRLQTCLNNLPCNPPRDAPWT